MTKLRRIDAATIGAYYGSDSAGTFVTCVGVLTGLVLAQKTLQEAGTHKDQVVVLLLRFGRQKQIGANLVDQLAIGN